MLRWIESLRQFQYVGLFLSLVGVLFLAPYADGSVLEFILPVLFAAIPAMAVIALIESRRAMVAGVILGVPATIAVLFDSGDDSVGAGTFGEVAPLAFYAFATAVICYHVVKERRVHADTLVGAVCGYLMIGYTWGAAYLVLFRHDPAAFVDANRETALTASDLFYFSFVTLTTLGYGDVAPVSTQARSLAMLEAVTGALYLAVLVSRLVALYGTELRREQSRGGKSA